MKQTERNGLEKCTEYSRDIYCKYYLCALLTFFIAFLLSKLFEADAPEYLDNKHCTALHNVGFDESSTRKFYEKYFNTHPVLLKKSKSAVFNQNIEYKMSFFKLTAKNSLKKIFGNLFVEVSTANTHTGRNWTDFTLSEYIDQLGSKNTKKLGNETKYLFGSHFGAEWDGFLSYYKAPTHNFKEMQWQETLSFGVADKYSGVPFHFHGPTFLELVHGSKMFYLFPPSTALKDFDPDKTTLDWLKLSLPKYTPNYLEDFIQCKIEQGDIMYFPADWLHATLNLDDYTVFIATFV
eukprot:maker-scaffold_7-snap-gene-12.44-mRNA-1 protein AED:0.01 eAED:0.01 QI:12/1/1/1/1/1/2/513/292